MRPRNVALVPQVAGWRLVPLGGFREDGGRQKLEELAALLTVAAADNP